MLTLLLSSVGPKCYPGPTWSEFCKSPCTGKMTRFAVFTAISFAQNEFSRVSRLPCHLGRERKKTKQGRCKHTNGKPPSVACFSWWKMRKEKNKPTGWHLEIVCMQKFSVTFARKQLPHAAFSFFLGIFQVGIQKLVICSADTTKWKFVQRTKHPTEKRENTQTSCN